MITNPAARTRALYLWETQDLVNRKGVFQIRKMWRTPQDLQLYCNIMWRFLTNRIDNIPRVEFSDAKDLPACYGWTYIRLTPGYRTNLVMVHELTHAMRYGTPGNPHSRGFVDAYIRNLSAWFEWSEGELTMQAQFRNLLPSTAKARKLRFSKAVVNVRDDYENVTYADTLNYQP